MPESSEQTRKLRWILLGAFGGMLLLMTVAGIDSLRSLGKLNQVSREVSHRYVEHNQALHTIVVLFHTYDNEVEQYLLADVIVANVPSRDYIEKQGTALHLAIHNYPADSNADERAPLKKIEEAVDLLDDALQVAKRTEERWLDAELHRHRGQLLLRQGHSGDAEELYRKALSIAAEQGAKLWELRAAASLARLRRDQGRRAEARDLLAPVYGWFTEGFDAPDLRDAKALLDELGSA